jgi:integrase
VRCATESLSTTMRRNRVAEGGREEDEALTPDEFQRLLDAVPDRFRLLVLTEIETGLRWGELIALRPRHVDFLRRTITVEETIAEVSKRMSPTSERMIVKPYPKDDDRTLRVGQSLLDELASRITSTSHRSRSPDTDTGVARSPIPGHCPATPERQTPWRARCRETGTAGSASGLGKRTGSNPGTAPQADSTTTNRIVRILSRP